MAQQGTPLTPIRLGREHREMAETIRTHYDLASLSDAIRDAIEARFKAVRRARGRIPRKIQKGA